jgi:hypothetical protein
MLLWSREYDICLYFLYSHHCFPSVLDFNETFYVSGNLQRLKFCPLQYIFFLCIGVTWEDLNPVRFNILATQHLNEN